MTVRIITILLLTTVACWIGLAIGQEEGEDQVRIDAEVAVVIKDFKENDTGLEYIGRPRQQMGDGGFSAQFMGAGTGELLAVSNDSWRCKVIHKAPLNRSCERSSDPVPPIYSS